MLVSICEGLFEDHIYFQDNEANLNVDENSDNVADDDEDDNAAGAAGDDKLCT